MSNSIGLRQKIKKSMRRTILQSLRIAARPTLTYRSSLPRLAMPPKKLLLIRPDHLGDILLTTPALSLLRAALPNTEITALVGPWGAASLVGNPDVDKVVRCNFPGFSREPNANPFAPYLYALQQSRRLRAEKYDAVINFRYDFWWGALLAYLADIPARFGFEWEEANPFQNFSLSLSQIELPEKLSPFGQPSQHFSSLGLALAKHLLQTYKVPMDLERVNVKLKFFPSPDDKRYVNLNLSEWGLERDERLVAIHPGTGATLKLWTVEGFAAVADTLAERYGAKVVLTGGPQEVILLKNITKICQNKPLYWDTSNSWGRLAALFERCDLVLGLDSGPLHLAVAVDVPSIHLFGPTDPSIFGPWGNPELHRVIRTEIDLPCCPCGILDADRSCWRGGYCMRTIKVSQVFGEVDKLLDRRPHS